MRGEEGFVALFTSGGVGKEVNAFLGGMPNLPPPFSGLAPPRFPFLSFPLADGGIIWCKGLMLTRGAAEAAICLPTGSYPPSSMYLLWGFRSRDLLLARPQIGGDFAL